MRQNKPANSPDPLPQDQPTSWRLLRKGQLLGLIQRNLWMTLLLTVIGLFYIWNAHHVEKKSRQLAVLKQMLTEKKSEYMTLNAELSASRKESHIRRMVDTFGLKPLDIPPYKIEPKNN